MAKTLQFPTGLIKLEENLIKLHKIANNPPKPDKIAPQNTAGDLNVLLDTSFFPIPTEIQNFRSLAETASKF